MKKHNPYRKVLFACMREITRGPKDYEFFDGLNIGGKLRVRLAANLNRF